MSADRADALMARVYQRSEIMVGITLSPEDVRSAPPEVRKWLEHEIARSLGLTAMAAELQPESEHLVAVTSDEAAAIFSSIRDMLPVVNVFFELGREGESIGRADIEAYRISEIVRHARLQSTEQLQACLDAINGALRLVRHDPKATLYAFDQRGYCLIATASQKSILAVWQEVVGSEMTGGADVARGGPAFSAGGGARAMGLPQMTGGYGGDRGDGLKR